MFTGIICKIGNVVELTKKRDSLKLVLDVPLDSSEVKHGASVAVSGVCLSVLAVRQNESQSFVEFELMPETVSKTTLGELKHNDKVNLELALRVGDRLDGHFVFGHVDGVGSVVDKSFDDNSGRLFAIAPPQELMRYIVPQGSVAIDGVSLTVARLEKKSFAVALTEDTLAKTTLRDLDVGSQVNIEADMLAKYAASFMKNIASH